MPWPRRRKLPLAWKIAAALAVVAVLGGWAFVGAARFLEAPATLHPTRADAALVLGGGFGDRERRAAELYRDGLAATFVLMGMEDSVNDKQIDYLHWRAKVLTRAGIPESALLIDAKSSTSEDEAAYAAALATARGWKRVIVVSDPPHMRRLAWVYGRAFEGSGIDVQLVATRPAWWSADRWWRSRKGAAFVVMEYVKFAYSLL